MLSAMRGTAACLAAVGVAAADATCRDRFLHPFSSDSIWNTAIGSGAVFAHAHLFNHSGRLPSSFHNDQEFFVAASSEDPWAPWVDQGTWGPQDNCAAVGDVVSALPLPAGFTTASDCDAAGVGCRSPAGRLNNNPMGVLLPDGETIVQMQPAYRCNASGPFFAKFGRGDGCPQTFPNVTSVFGNGTLGAHGGSGLSGVGGMVRLGELLPGAPPIAHALKLELNHLWYYGAAKLQPDTPQNQNRSQYVWPATGSDSGTEKAPGGLYLGTDPHVAPGALLAVPGDVAAALVGDLKTVVGAKILEALTDYGGYLVDDTGAVPVGGGKAAICMDAQVNQELREAYGYTLTYAHTDPGVGPSPTDPGQDLWYDLLRVFQNLHAVTNNAPGAVGGGGAPRRPRAPPICGDPGGPQIREPPPPVCPS